MFKLNHLATKRAAESGVFLNLTDFDEMVKRIREIGSTFSEPGGDEYNDFVGSVYEVYTEFFFKRYGTSANPHLGVRTIEDTSKNKYQAGYDFTYENFQGEPCLLQVKFRSNPTEKFDQNTFGTFCFQAMALGITKKSRLIWFTNVTNSGEDGIFNRSIAKQGNDMMRVFGREQQKSFIDRDPAFFKDLQLVVSQALIQPMDWLPFQEMWEHQDRMAAACEPILDNGGNGRIICATGGGKTRVILENVVRGFAKGFRTIVVVAPTIDLLRQHHDYFRKYGLFHRDGISVIHFRTGDDSQQVDDIGWTDIKQTTFVDDVEEWLTPKTIIFVTYASEFKLFEGMRKKDMSVDLVQWDEYHHTVRQDLEQIDHLQSIPTNANLFFSASIKRGRMLSGNDPEIYGPVLQEVRYSELRMLGILVPKIVVKVVRLKDGKRIKGIKDALREAAKRENFNLETATMEAAGTIAAYRDRKAIGGVTNIVTFSKAVPICKELVVNEYVKKHFDGLLQTVHSGVPSRDRKKVYEQVKNSDDSVLCQFSVVKEGIDINPFNTVVFSRGMDIIGTQQAIGRAVRAHPDDTKALHAGQISIDDPTGWKKHSAILYVIIHEQDSFTFNDFLIDLVSKLQFTGLLTEELAFEDMIEGLHGTGEKSDDLIVSLDKELNMIGAKSLEDAVKNTVIEIQKMQDEMESVNAFNRQLAELEKISMRERLSMLMNGKL